MAHYTDSNVKIMTDCHDTCLQAVSHCLDTGGDHARTQHITLLLDCAEICQTELISCCVIPSCMPACARYALKFAIAAPKIVRD